MDKQRAVVPAQAQEQGSPILFEHTINLPQLFEEHRFSLLVSTYQANRLLLFTAANGRLSMLMRILPRPTALALENTRLAVSSRQQIWFFRRVHNVRGTDEVPLPHDAVWLPRRSHVTGYIDTHGLAWQNDQLLVVNTRYSCLCRLDDDWSFVPKWKPPFVSEIAPEDRCHLNGLCLDETGPRYMTALGETDAPDGWRAGRADGGIVIDLTSNRILTRGLSMPHSPKLYAGRLWVLGSGTGSLLIVDQMSGEISCVMRFSGFLRGLAFYKQLAFVGLCKAREKEHFGNLPVEQELGELQCGVSIVDLQQMRQIGFIHFLRGVEELFDIAVMPQLVSPLLVGFEDDLLDRIKVAPAFEGGPA